MSETTVSRTCSQHTVDAQSARTSTNTLKHLPAINHHLVTSYYREREYRRP
jgi:hypothetical protein